jgi:hypothetical protein
MKICTVVGDLSSDSYSEQFPRVSLCDVCVAEDQSLPEDMQSIRDIEEYDSADGRCVSCLKFAEDEAEEADEKEG